MRSPATNRRSSQQRGVQQAMLGNTDHAQRVRETVTCVLVARSATLGSPLSH